MKKQDKIKVPKQTKEEYYLTMSTEVVACPKCGNCIYVGETKWTPIKKKGKVAK